VVEPGGEHVVEAVGGDVGQVVLADEAAVGHEGDPPDAEAPLQVLHHARERRDVRRVAREDVVGDGDAVGGDEESDHDLRAVGAVVPAVAEGEGGKGPPPDGGRLEVARGEVVADEAEVQVGQRAELGVEVGLRRLLCLGEGVDRPVALVEARCTHASRQCHGLKPLGDRAPLGRRFGQAVGHHGKDRVGEHSRAPAVAEGGEVLLEAEATKVRPDRRHRPEARRREALELTGFDIGALGVGGQRLDDPVELTGLAQLGHLAETEQGRVRVLPVHPHRLDQRQVLVGLVATATDGPLHEHTRILQRCRSNVVECVAPTFCLAGSISPPICPTQGPAGSPSGQSRAKLRSEWGSQFSIACSSQD